MGVSSDAKGSAKFPGGSPSPKVNSVKGPVNQVIKSTVNSAVNSKGGTHVKSGRSAANGAANGGKA